MVFNRHMTTGSTPRGKTIRVYLVDGTPQGLRVVERNGWTGSCLAFARADYIHARSKTQLTRTGVYVLVGPDESGERTLRLYVGEGDDVRTRIDLHQREKDFWTNGYVLTANDGSLDKAHVRYLESRLISLARAAGNAAVDNSTTPPIPHLTESDASYMESYLDSTLILLPLVGVHVFDVLNAVGQAASSSSTASSLEGTRYYFRSQLTYAEAVDDARGFTVLEGAKGRAETRAMTPGYDLLRSRLIVEGLLVPDGDQQLRLVKNYVFESPSSAASVLSGGSKNGRIEWRDANNRTLKENQEQVSAGA